MPKFSAASEAKLATCHKDLQVLFHRVVEIVDCTVICGYRGKEEQDEAVRLDRSKTPWPTSKHNSEPSTAVDVAPFPIDWRDTRRFDHFAGVVRGVAHELGIKIRWGGDWNGNFVLADQTFNDLPHFEIG